MRKVFIKTFFKLLVVLGVVFVLQNEPPKQASANQVEKPNAAATTSTVSQVKVEPTVPSAPTVTPPVSTPPPQPVAKPVAVTNCGSDPYMAQIYQRESGCRTNAVNPSSGAYGICQALPGTKMASAGADWQTSWETQNSW